MIPHRPRSYYFSDDDATAEKKRRSRKREEFKDAGVSGEDVLERSRAPWVGHPPSLYTPCYAITSKRRRWRKMDVATNKSCP